VLISSRTKISSAKRWPMFFSIQGNVRTADLLERIRLLLVRKRGPKRSVALRVCPRSEHATVA